jgi:Zn-dependent M28 family amino/carboxypeptidase
MRILVIFFILLSSTCFSQDFQKHVSYLASDSLHGRAPGTVNEAIAARYISQYLTTTCKAKIKLQKFYYIKDSLSKDSAVNIIGEIDRGQKETLILSAHYDHLGTGSGKSREVLHRNAIHNGADDNASGVSMVLELGKWLALQKNCPFNVVLFFSSGHEDGIYGSKYLAGSSFIDTAHLSYFINFDMVGRMDSQSKGVHISGIDKDSSLRAFFASTQTFNVRIDDEDLDHTDAGPFQGKSKHTVNISTGIHDDYHKSSDDETKINYDGMKLIYDRVKELLISIPAHH